MLKEAGGPTVMLTNTLKRKMQKRQTTIGSWITLGHTSIAEIMARAGFEWLVVDMEHSAITLDIAQQLILAIEACGATPLVRVEENNASLIKRVMDAGAYGVIVPMVNSKREAEAAVAAVKYPPVGKRGVGLARAQGYGDKFDEYAAAVNDESVVVVQIEHIDAVNNLESILSVEGVDGCIVGPYDLSGSLGVPGCFEHPDVLAALDKVERTCSRQDVALGFHIIQPDHTLVIERVSKGYTFVALSLDILFLGNSCREEMSQLRGRLT
ncbi:MAG: aldolase/citrate lyase family protein [Chloroflexota bacterium]|nr:aldolase/citrate lyase family protein [Chloroflexota bacterium]